jgi:Holliday junction resolvase RusA-like endonuclease
MLPEKKRDARFKMPGMLRPAGKIVEAIEEKTGSNACSDREIQGIAGERGNNQINSKLTFFVPGEPVAKGRARAFVRHGVVAHYTPDKTARYENLVKISAKNATNGSKPLEGPLSLRCTFWLSVPMSYSNRRREACLNGSERHCKRPDIDNLLKSVKDGCNGVAWIDDCQVVEVSALKSYGETPGVDIEICSLA